jgi:hypothetical protein
MGLLPRSLRLSGPTHGRPPFSFRLSPTDVVPMVPDLISSPRVFGKQALILVNQFFLLVAKLPTWNNLRVLLGSGQALNDSDQVSLGF